MIALKFSLQFIGHGVGKVLERFGYGLFAVAEKVDVWWKRIRRKRYVHATTLWTWEYSTKPVEFGHTVVKSDLLRDMLRGTLDPALVPEDTSVDGVGEDGVVCHVGDSVNFRVGLLKMEDAALLKLKYGGQMKEQKLYELV
jgi:hypothetical protein